MLRIALRVLYPTSSSLGGLVQYIELLSAVSVSSTLPQIFNFFLTYAREKAILCVFFLSVISRFSLGHRSVGKRQRMGGYKQGQGTHKTIQNGQKVIRSVTYINLTRTYINFCFAKSLHISNLRIANINRRIWI